MSLRFTIFTPTYNRAHMLSRVYTSLINQTFLDFEWIIVDDGSNDNTAALVNTWTESGRIRITYIYQKNSGKHVAYNKALKIAKGDIFFALDSDDSLTHTALNEVNIDCLSVETKKHSSIAGFRYLSCFKNGVIVGDKYPFEPIVGGINSVNEKFNLSGDKPNFIVTEIAKEFQFPVYEGEKFCPEGLIWNRISRDYLFIHKNRPLQIVEYQADGLSANILKIKKKSPHATLAFYREAIDCSNRSTKKIKNAANFVRFSLHNKSAFMKEIGQASVGLLFVSIALGGTLYFLDKYKK